MFTARRLRGYPAPGVRSCTTSVQSQNRLLLSEQALAVGDVDVERCRAWLGLAAGLRLTDRFDEAFAAEALGHRSGLGPCATAPASVAA
jgi:hypothetical protein